MLLSYNLGCIIISSNNSIVPNRKIEGIISSSRPASSLYGALERNLFNHKRINWCSCSCKARKNHPGHPPALGVRGMHTQRGDPETALPANKASQRENTAEKNAVLKGLKTFWNAVAWSVFIRIRILPAVVTASRVLPRKVGQALCSGNLSRRETEKPVLSDRLLLCAQIDTFTFFSFRTEFEKYIYVYQKAD